MFAACRHPRFLLSIIVFTFRYRGNPISLMENCFPKLTFANRLIVIKKPSSDLDIKAKAPNLTVGRSLIQQN